MTTFSLCGSLQEFCVSTVDNPWLMKIISAVHQGHPLAHLLVLQGGLDPGPLVRLTHYRAAVVGLQHHPEVLQPVLSVWMEGQIVSHQDIVRLVLL